MLTHMELWQLPSVIARQLKLLESAELAHKQHRSTLAAPTKVAPLHTTLKQSLHALGMNVEGARDAPAARDLIAALNAISAAELAAELRANEAGDGQDVRPLGHEPMDVDRRRPDGAQQEQFPAQPARDGPVGRRDLELVQTLEGHTDRVWAVAWSPDGEPPSNASAATVILPSQCVMRAQQVGKQAQQTGRQAQDSSMGACRCQLCRTQSQPAPIRSTAVHGKCRHASGGIVSTDFCWPSVRKQARTSAAQIGMP